MSISTNVIYIGGMDIRSLFLEAYNFDEKKIQLSTRNYSQQPNFSAYISVYHNS